VRLKNFVICFGNISNTTHFMSLNNNETFKTTTKKRTTTGVWNDRFLASELMLLEASSLHPPKLVTSSSTKSQFQSEFGWSSPIEYLQTIDTSSLPLGVRARLLSRAWIRFLSSQMESEPAKKKDQSVSVDVDPSMLKLYSYIPEVLAVLSYKSVTVLKLMSFSPSLDNFEAWVQMIVDMNAKRKSRGLGDNLIIDVSANGGGYVCLNQWLLSYLVASWSNLSPTFNSTPFEPYDLRKTSLLEQLAKEGYFQSEIMYDPLTGKEFNQESLDWFWRGLNYTRSGRTWPHTRRVWYDACRTELSSSLPKPNYFYDKIIVITDGLCGSACSYFISKLRKDNKVRLLSYGGLIDQSMETSSFAGGTVIEWSKLIAELQELNISSPSFVPFTTSALMSWSLFELYIGGKNVINGSSTDPNVLPREFNKLVADWHINIWAPLVNTDPNFSKNITENLFVLYEIALPYFDTMQGGLPSEGKPRSNNTSAIIVLSIFGLLLLGLLGFVIVYLVRKMRRTREQGTFSEF